MDGDVLFRKDRQAIEKRVLAIRDEKAAESKVKFDEWVQKKLEEKRAILAAVRAKRLREQQEENEKKQKAEKAYQKWLKLEQRGKYVSTLTGKKQKVPTVVVATHHVPWSKETDLAEFYSENDRRSY